MSYSCIFFDLDHTLWDYETNAREALTEVYDKFKLAEEGVEDINSFCELFKEVNLNLWDLYDREQIGVEVIRTERFRMVFKKFNISNDNLANQIAKEYLVVSPTKCNLLPHAMETLQYLSSKHRLTIITNGFEETQHVKLTSGNINHFFDHVITAQKAGFKKPAPQIFEYALKCNNIDATDALMVGDNLITDIAGARNAAIHTVFYNPERIAHKEIVNYEITCLKDLCDLF